jgi:low temperature requirement protein LtrA
MPLLAPMPPRDTHEEHRSATPLELFFDLTLVFFAIWWAWMNFTWFASAYDNDDVAYRLTVFVLMTGVLILAAGVPRAFDDQDFGVITLGYVVMRLAMVGLWLRVAAQHPEGRPCALRYALGITLLQIGWVLRLALPEGAGLVAFFVLVVLELSVPAWAEAIGRTAWHPRHIAERYALFTIIVLGESVLGATVGVQTALDLDTHFEDVATVVVGGLLTLFAMWWIYFDMPTERLIDRARESSDAGRSGAFAWGYGHYFVFGAAAAMGAGLVVMVDQVTDHSELTDAQAAFAFTVPVVVYLIMVWMLHMPFKVSTPLRNFGVPVAACLILLSSFTPEPVLLTGFVLVALVAASVANQAAAD